MVERNLNLIRKIVWSYVRKNPGIEFDDLFSEACLACLEAQKMYKPEKGAESTFIWQVVSSKLKTILGRDAKASIEFLQAGTLQTDGFDPEPGQDTLISRALQDEYMPSLEQEYIMRENWEELYSGLSPEAQFICDFLLNDSETYLPTDKPRTCKGMIIQILRQQNWRWNDIWTAFKEIKQALSPSPLTKI